MAASPPACKGHAIAVVVMGVSGCGKSSIGALLAERLGASFIEGDNFHPPGNIAKMSAGVPLQDDDRWPWLDLLGARLKEACAQGEAIVISCSALKKAYRERLRNAAKDRLLFVYLDGSRELLHQRMVARSDHFMSAAMLESQLATLEKPTGEDGVVAVDIDATIEDIVEAALGGLGQLNAIEGEPHV